MECPETENLLYGKGHSQWNKAAAYRMFHNLKSDRGLIFKIYKLPKRLDINRPNNPIKNNLQM